MPEELLRNLKPLNVRDAVRETLLEIGMKAMPSTRDLENSSRLSKSAARSIAAFRPDHEGLSSGGDVSTGAASFSPHLNLMVFY
jgi:hypothetical protein